MYQQHRKQHISQTCGWGKCSVRQQAVKKKTEIKSSAQHLHHLLLFNYQLTETQRLIWHLEHRLYSTFNQVTVPSLVHNKNDTGWNNLLSLVWCTVVKCYFLWTKFCLRKKVLRQSIEISFVHYRVFQRLIWYKCSEVKENHIYPRPEKIHNTKLPAGYAEIMHTVMLNTHVTGGFPFFDSIKELLGRPVPCKGQTEEPY